MPHPDRPASRLPKWASDGLLLTAANLAAAVGNYIFQAVMRRHLSWAEFGYLNTTLSLFSFAGLPLAAAGQTLVHRLARGEAAGNAQHVVDMQAASLKVLRVLTGIVFFACVVLIVPVADYLRFPRMSLAWAGLFCLPVTLWSVLGGAWCSGLSRFRLLAALLLVGTAIRVVAGAVGVEFYPQAEVGIIAGALSGLVLAAIAIFSPHHAATASVRQIILQRDWLVYGAGSLAVAVGAFLFMQGDQLMAQRAFDGHDLGRYTGAGLLGRAAVWGSLPVLTVYFTRRSGAHPDVAAAAELFWAYFLLFGMGVCAILLLRVPLLQLLLGVSDPALTGLTARFALSIIPLGALQAIGCRYLALQRIPECLAFGACGLVYVGALSVYGRTPGAMLHGMATGGTIAITALGLFSFARRLGKERPPVA